MGILKTHKFRIVHVNNGFNGSYYKIQQKTFWGWWRNVYVSGDVVTHHCGFIRYEDAEEHLKWVKELDEKGVVQKFINI